MAHEWLEYIRKFDNLVEEALRCCVNNSLQTLFNVLHGDGTLGPSPLLVIDVDLHENQVCLRICLYFSNFSPHAVGFLTEHPRDKRVHNKPSKNGSRDS